MKRIVQIYFILFITFFLCGCNDVSQTFKERAAFYYETILIGDKEFTSTGGFYYYDLSTYNYNKRTKTHSVDILMDRDPSTDFGYYDDCPYDNGIITHILLNLSYSEITEKFQAKYIGFLSQEQIIEYENNKPVSCKHEPIKIYYDDNPKLIPELQIHLDFLNNEINRVDSSYKDDMLQYFYNLR